MIIKPLSILGAKDKLTRVLIVLETKIVDVFVDKNL